MRRFFLIAAIAVGCSGGGSGTGGGIVAPTSTTNANLVSWSGTSGGALTDAGFSVSGAVLTSRTLTAGTGLSGGGTLSSDATLTLGTTDPQAITVGGALTAGNGVTLGTGNLTMTQGNLKLSLTSGITACTGQAQGLCPLTTEVNQIGVVGVTNDSVTLPAIPSAGSIFALVRNDTATTMKLFPASGGNVCTNASCAGTNAAQSVVGNKIWRCVNFNTTNWICNNSDQ